MKKSILPCRTELCLIDLPPPQYNETNKSILNQIHYKQDESITGDIIQVSKLTIFFNII